MGKDQDMFFLKIVVMWQSVVHGEMLCWWTTHNLSKRVLTRVRLISLVRVWSKRALSMH